MSGGGDEIWKDKLMTQLGVVQQEGLLNLWDDRRISAGEDATFIRTSG